MDSFIVSARKYRPLKWSDVVGQEHVAQTLKNALSKSQIAHAFLFCGPRGVGKTTCARILARALNCSNPGADWEPCNECASCKASMENVSFNIFELDAASNNSVDDIRELVDQVRFQPQTGKYKIYIVDEVHMLSQSAFNAFLKTLEEPPPFAKFILATTEKHKILPTILSRCQVYDFRRITERDIVQQLTRIAENEKITIEEEGLHLIAQKADGAMRDALSMFDRIRSFSGSQISYKDVAENLNVLDHEYFFRFIDSFLTQDYKSCMILIGEVLQKGFDADVLLEGLAGHIRNLLIVKEPAMVGLLEGSDQLKLRYNHQADACNLSLLVKWLDQLNEAEVNLIRARNKRLHTEIVFIKICCAPWKHLIPAEENISLTDSKNVTKSASQPIQEKPVPQHKAKKVIVTPSQTVPDPLNIPKLGNFDHLKIKIEEEEIKRKKNLIPFTSETAMNFWERIVEEEPSASLKAILKHAVVEIELHAIKIFVGNVISRESIRAELKLDEKIRNTFSDKLIQYQIEIDPSLAEHEDKKPAKILSGKEKYELMLGKNPQLQVLKDKLQLKLDED